MKAKTTISVTITAGFTRRSTISVDGEIMRVDRVEGAHTLVVRRLRWWHRAWRRVDRTLDCVWRWIKG